VSVSAETSVVRLTLPALPEYLMFSRLVLTGLSRAVEIDPETLADLKLAVSEACSYAVRSSGETDGTIAVRYELGPGEVAVDVEAELLPGPPAKLDEQEDVDLGLAIIVALVDELDVQRAENGQLARISFRKRLSVEPSTES
jgi:serine/threonine-protein kinase RsbW